MLYLQDVTINRGSKIVFYNWNAKIENSKVTIISGKNGVGKSTIFNLIIGLLKPDYGNIIINNQNVLDYPIAERSSKFNLGYCPQYGGFFFDLTLLENLKAVAEIQIPDPKSRLHKIEQLIAKFEFETIVNIQAKFLSGGQKKKLVIAMALLNNPKVLLLDEPFAALDVLTIKMLKELIVNLQYQEKISICICDHQARDLLSCVDNAIILSNCKVIARGTPAELVNNIKAQNAYFGNSFKFN